MLIYVADNENKCWVAMIKVKQYRSIRKTSRTPPKFYKFVVLYVVIKFTHLLSNIIMGIHTML